MVARTDAPSLPVGIPAPWHQVKRSVLARILVLPVAGVAGLLTARVIVSAIGVSGYGLAALVATLPALLPSADLGVGAAVTTAVADDRPREEMLGVLLSSLRVLLALSGAIVVLSLTLAATSMWSALTGLAATDANNWAIGLSVALFGLSLPLAIGSRILLGSGRNFMVVLLQGLSAPVVLAICLVGRSAHAGIWLYAAAPACGLLAMGAAACRQASRHCDVDLLLVLRRALSPSAQGSRIRHVAGPMAVISACLPLAYQSDRLILSHVSSVTQLAVYSAGAALFAPALSLVSAGGQSLWPIFVRTGLASLGGNLRRQFFTALTGLVAFGVVLGVALVLVGPSIGTWMLRSGAAVPVGLMASFAAVLIVLSAHYPGGMLLTDSAGLRFQAKASVAMLMMNVALSLVLARRLGAAGPVLGSAISVALCMWLPTLRSALHRLAASGRKSVPL